MKKLVIIGGGIAGSRITTALEKTKVIELREIIRYKIPFWQLILWI